jgi:hypothetical protein
MTSSGEESAYMGYPEGQVFWTNFLSRLLKRSQAMMKAIAAPAMHVPIAIPATASLLTPLLPVLLLVASAEDGT